jgi:putative tryptophan/tyrosine transport system substrate-binding protein
MKRRDVLRLAGAAPLAWSLPAFANSRPRPLIGILFNGRAESPALGWVLDGMRQAGYANGRDFDIVARYSGNGHDELLPALAVELVALNPDVILASATSAGRAAKAATSTIPIVVAHMTDPVGAGLAVSLAHPGTNVTGNMEAPRGLAGKLVEFASAVTRPGAPIGFLEPPGGDRTGRRHDVEEAAKGAVAIVPAGVAGIDEIDKAVSFLAGKGAGSVIVEASTFFFNERERVARSAIAHRLPAISEYREFAVAGGFLSYGIDIPAIFRHAAVFVVRILKGAKPQELPIEFPTHVPLVVNLKTAKAISLEVPATLLASADEVIE